MSIDTPPAARPTSTHRGGTPDDRRPDHGSAGFPAANPTIGYTGNLEPIGWHAQNYAHRGPAEHRPIADRSPTNSQVLPTGHAAKSPLATGTVREIAERMGVSISTVEYARRQAGLTRPVPRGTCPTGDEVLDHILSTSSAREAAERLGVSYRTVQRWRNGHTHQISQSEAVRRAWITRRARQTSRLSDPSLDCEA